MSGASGNTHLALAGARFFYTHTVNQSELVLLDPSSGRERTLHRSLQGIGSPTFAADGGRLAVFTVGSAPEAFSLALFDLRAGMELERLDLASSGFMPQWSTSRDELYYYRLAPTRGFAMIDLVEGAEVTLAEDWDWGREHGANVHPGGARIVYSVLDRGLPTATLLRELDTGTEQPFHTTLKWPRFSSDGSRILGTRFGEGHGPVTGSGTVLICQVEQPRCDDVASGRFARWAHDESRIYFTRTTDEGVALFSVDPRTPDRVEMVHPNLGVAPHNDFFDVGPAGQITWIRDRPLSSLWISRLE